MINHGSVEVIDKTGWSKSYPIDRRITQIGGGDWNHIVIDTSRGTGVHPNQAQLIYLPEEGGVFRLVNLGEATVIVQGAASEKIAPLSYVDITQDTRILVGEFVLAFRFNNSAAREIRHKTDNLEAALIFNDEQLLVGGALIGKLVIANKGNQAHTQFVIDLVGLPDGCYEVAPPPLLFPGAEAELAVRIFHRTRVPQAGKTTFEVTVSAPHTYPGEEIKIDQTIYVSPHLEYFVDLHTGQVTRDIKPALPVAAPALSRVQKSASVPVPYIAVAAALEEEKTPEKIEEAAPPEIQPDEPSPIVEEEQPVITKETLPEEDQPSAEEAPPEAAKPILEETAVVDESAWLIDDEDDLEDTETELNLTTRKVRVLKAEVSEDTSDLDLVTDSADHDLQSEIEDGWWGDSDQDSKEE